MATCGVCGRDNPDDARFCNGCGADLSPARSSEARKTVTVLFCDLVGSTALTERLDPESVRAAVGRYFDVGRTVLEHHGGTVEKFAGDAVMAAFGVPRVHEDDAVRAVRAGVDLRERLVALAEQLAGHGIDLRVRIGVATGEVVVGDPSSGEGFVTGDAVNVAARLEQSAEPGEILVGGTTYRLVRDAVEVEAIPPIEVRGKSRPVEAYRLLSVVPGAPGHVRRFDTPMVGRLPDLQTLRQALERAVTERSCVMALVLGGAGVGKTRLVEEFVGDVREDRPVLRGRCLPYGEGITYWPVSTCVRQAAGLEGTERVDEVVWRIKRLVARHPEADLVAERIMHLLGLDPARAIPSETFWAVRGFLEALAADRPPIVVLDDLQWAEPTLLDLLQYVLDRSRAGPILLVGVARTEVLEVRPGWGGVDPRVIPVMLDPLSDEETGSIVGNLLGGPVDPEILDRVVQTAEGNPLYVEELLCMLEERGLLLRTGGVWSATTGLAALPVPESVNAILTAHVEDLDPAERATLERASVIGEIFPWAAVEALSTGTGAGSVGRNLMNLSRKHLIRPAASDLAGGDAYRFRHVLLRDAAYQGLAKASRAELHEAFADWLERRTVDRASSCEEIVGYHLEQAHRYLGQIGPVDRFGEVGARRTTIGARASSLLASAAGRASERGDDRVAVALLDRAVALRPAGDPVRAELMVWLAQRLAEGGDPGTAARCATDALDAARRSGDRPVEARASLVCQLCRALVRPRDVSFAEISRNARVAIPILDAAGDRPGLLWVLGLAGNMAEVCGRLEVQAEVSRRAMELARDWGMAREEASAVGAHMGALAFGPTPVEDVVEIGRRLLVEAGDNRPLRIEAGWRLGMCLTWAGRYEEGMELAGQMAALAEDIGYRAWGSIDLALFEALMDVHGGRPDAAASRLRENVQTLQNRGQWSLLSSNAATLARILVDLGEEDEATRLARIALDNSATDDVHPQVVARTVQALVLAHRREPSEAEVLARGAVERAAPTDWVELRADALRDLASVLRIAGQRAKARTALQQAIALYERKGLLVSSTRARAMLRGQVVAGR